jgi:hypothetical protein
MCIASPKDGGLGTEVKVLGVFSRAAKQPKSRITSAGRESSKMVF